MARLINPFVVYGYKGAEYFCDRQKETEKMISSLHNERNITLVAPRRMGKTGLIHHVFHQMEEQYEGVKCCYVPMQQKIRRDVISEASWLLSKEPRSHHVRHCTSLYVSLRRRIRLRWVTDSTALGDGYDCVG